MSFYSLAKAEASSVLFSDDEDDLSNFPKSIHKDFLSDHFRSIRMSEVVEDPGASQRTEREPTFGTSESQAMRSELDHIRAALTNLTEASTHNAMTTPPQRSSHAASSMGFAQPPRSQPLENVLEGISTRLTSIESLYADMVQRIAMGPRIGTLPGSMTPGRYSTGHSTSTMPRMSPSATLNASSHLTATVQQHASQIHKLIAGLDFLEQQIARQDGVIESIQRQAVESMEGRGPSELSLQVHDMSELLNKLRAHMYKIDKRSAAGEAGTQVLSSQLSQLASRVAVLESENVALRAGSGGGGSGGAATNTSSSVNPLFFDASGSPQIPSGTCC
ncbi:hypothetical protein CEUSTIGMA_g2736.t1 [Chlamydomonas eustigma]|uniref:Uncharacterized protein n=1 Tax=Chlamydomonas eustigma TaxID=1157962 RepID=A0A250WWU7_9CHLO|nr:hypothetical protein CEUSTIGMA_g2736.t1 [Chlamydomonas eustigma]|eukprot:GAX75291.1 hypothetical protein CEUSTIGMA_g2736.t1 [Chlamydomonas eustigma]